MTWTSDARVRCDRARTGRHRQRRRLLACQGRSARARNRAVRTRSRARRIARPLAYHSALVRHPGVRAARQRSVSRVGRARARRGRTSRLSNRRPRPRTAPAARFRSRDMRMRCARATSRSSGSTPHEIRGRWPAFTIEDDVRGLYQEDGGIVAAERATAAHQRAARALRRDADRARAGDVVARAERGEIYVEAGGRRYGAGRLIVAAGPWSARMLANLRRSHSARSDQGTGDVFRSTRSRTCLRSDAFRSGFGWTIRRSMGFRSLEKRAR